MKISTSAIAFVAAAAGPLAFAATPPQKNDAMPSQPQCLYAGQYYGEGSIVRVTDKTFIQCAPKSSMVVFDAAGATPLTWRMLDAEDSQTKSKK